MPYQPTLNFRLSNGTDLGSLGWITKEYLMSVYPQIAANMITPELWVWGSNGYGALGDNTSNTKSIPSTTSAGGANWKQVSAGQHVAAIKTDGTLWTWGMGHVGQLGANNTFNAFTPVTTFIGGTNWKQVSCFGINTAAIKTDGTLWTWGWNAYGQLGDNTTTNRLTPVTTFAGGNNWKQVSCGSFHTAAIKTDGTLWVWGRNNNGQLGTNDTNGRTTPVQTSLGGTNWKQVAGGDFHTAAIKTDGTLWLWGLNSNGQLGTNDTNGRTTPVQTSLGGTNWKQVAGGYGGYTAAIKTDGTLWTWGYNLFGKLGNNSQTNAISPVTTFAGGTSWKQVSCGNNQTAAIKTDGTLWSWGNNSVGQMGVNTILDPILTPVTTFAGGTNWKQVYSGSSNYIVAIRTSDDLLGI
jgi:alpha-tubulin suppressor-like RCC1 family protein